MDMHFAWGSKIILLVEDDPNDVLLIRRAFVRTAPDLQLRVVGDGETARQYLGGIGVFADRQENPLPALVLLDLKLPRKTGFELLEWMKSDPSLSQIPVIVHTSSREPNDIERACTLGARYYLVKPSRPEDLRHAIRAVVDFLFLGLGDALELLSQDRTGSPKP